MHGMLQIVGATVARQQLQATVDRDLALQQAPQAEDGLHLRPHTESAFMPQPNGHAKGTVVMYHGYTAAPWQYPEMAKRFFDAGYNVYVPRMPGHGFADDNDMPTGALLPNSHQRQVYESFIDHTWQDAAGLGAPVYTVGLSGGANLALRTAEKHPEVAGVAAISPYLGGNPPKGLIFAAVTFLDHITFHMVSHLLDHIGFEKNVKAPDDPTPHTKGSMGQAACIEEVGSDVRHISCPVQIVSSQGDFLSGTNADRRLLSRCGGREQSGWYLFHQDEHVPHAMLSPLENHVPGAAQKVSDIVFNFVDKGELAQRT
ncbi:MAG: alpha/beta hydrolase [Candidatus Xenobia bacterium]